MDSRKANDRDVPEPTPHRAKQTGEMIDAFVVGDVRWTVELWDHGVHGIEARLLRDSEFSHSFRWPTRELAINWVKTERHDIERKKL
jgi:hypothetical protein